MKIDSIQGAIYPLGFDVMERLSDDGSVSVLCMCPCGRKERFSFTESMSIDDIRSVAIDHIREDIAKRMLPEDAIYGRDRPEWTYPVDWSVSQL